MADGAAAPRDAHPADDRSTGARGSACRLRRHVVRRLSSRDFSRRGRFDHGRGEPRGCSLNLNVSSVERCTMRAQAIRVRAFPAIALALLISIPVAARSASLVPSIENFGTVNERYYRGAQPTGRAYT